MARRRRSLHFVPGGNDRMLARALTLPADGLILDLEDAVAPARPADVVDQRGEGFAEPAILRIAQRHERAAAALDEQAGVSAGCG